MVVCMHLCRGNFAGAWVAGRRLRSDRGTAVQRHRGGRIFSRYELAAGRQLCPAAVLPKGKTAVLGLVTTKSPVLESSDAIRRRIDEAGRYAPLDQLALSPQCGFSSGIGGNAMTVADEIAKLKLVVDTARDVWGEA